MPRKTFVPLVAALGLALLTVAAGELSAQRSAPLTPADISPAFAIPSSGLVFEGILTLPTGEPVPFEAREGSMTLLDPTHYDPEGRLGIMLTLDRDLLRRSGKLGFRATVTGIGPHPDGGDHQETRAYLKSPYRQDLEIKQPEIDLKIKITGHHFEEFRDGLLVTLLWEAVKTRGEDALRGLYHELNLIYGPTSQDCRICNGVLICGTTVTCEDEGGGGYK